MYEYIIGKYIGLNKDYIVVENNEIGYKIFTSGSTIAKIPKINEKIKLYVEQIVREDFIGLYGFLSLEELEMFKILLTINGVGSKAALSLLSISNVTNLKYSILIGDEKHITRAPGIGKKTAQRIILELKDKFKSDELLNEENNIEQEDIQNIESLNKIQEALSALIALGYTEKEGNKALKEADKNDNVENIIKSCLRMLIG